MARQHDDRHGARPYKTYKAGRSRRSQLDDELMGARPARRPRAPDDDRRRIAPDDRRGAPDDRRRRAPDDRRSAPDDRRRGAPDDSRLSDKAYRAYGPAAEGRGGGRKRGAGSGSRRRRRFRWWHVPAIIASVLVIAGVVLTVLAWPGYKKFDRAVDNANKRLDDDARAELTEDDGWIWRSGTTVLLFGLDEANLPAHSDTIMLMRFDPESHKVHQLSIPRDTLVNVEGYGQQKLTQAMWFGGPALAVKTVREFTGIPINHVMIVGFQGFPRLVDAVGGVDLYVPQTVTTEAGAQRNLVTYKKGMHHFNGRNAMLYVRIRKAYAEGDFTRAARQQAFLQALQKKLVRPSNIPKLPQIGSRFMSGVSTDLTTNQVLELAYVKWRADGGQRLVMKGKTGWYEGQSVVLPPSESSRERMIRRFLGE